MANGINATMQTMEPAVLDHPPDRALAVTERIELLHADHSVLLERQPREDPTPWGI